MADNRWLGKALNITQVDTITIANTWAQGDTCTITCNGLDLVLTAGTAVTTGDIAAALSAAYNATSATQGVIGSGAAAESRNVGGQEIPSLQEMQASVAGAVVTITHLTAGVPFTISVSETTVGTGTATLATATAADGMHFLTNADNWSDGVPTADDVLIFDSGSVGLLYGLTYLRSGTTVDSGTTDGTGTGLLQDSTQNFVTTVTVGDTVFNTTDGTQAVVTGINSNVELIIDSDIMVSGEDYTIGTGIETALTRTTDYTGGIGLPVQSVRSYKEYRQRQLQLYNKTADKELLFRRGVFTDVGGITRLDADYQTYSKLTVLNPGKMEVKPNIEVSGGTMPAFITKGFVSFDPDEAQPTTPFVFPSSSLIGSTGLEDRETVVHIGPGKHDPGSAVEMTQYSGLIRCFTNISPGSGYITPQVYGGNFVLEVDSDIEGAIISSGGVLVWNGTGTEAAIIAIHTGGTLDASLSNGVKTYSGTVNMYGGSTAKFVIEPGTSILTFTGCTRGDVTITNYGS